MVSGLKIGFVRQGWLSSKDRTCVNVDRQSTHPPGQRNKNWSWKQTAAEATDACPACVVKFISRP